MKLTMITTILLIFSIISNAQDKFYIRSDGGITHAIINSNLKEITADYNYPHKKTSNYDASWGLYLGGLVYKNLYVELGFNYQAFSDRFTILSDNYTVAMCFGGSNAFIIVPLNASYNCRILNSKFYAIPHLGISFISRLEKENYRTDITFENMETLGINLGTINNTTKYSTFPAEPANDFGFLLNAGIGFEYKILKRLGITLNGNYSLGFDEINRYVILLKAENNLIGNLSYEGTHYSVECGLKFYF